MKLTHHMKFENKRNNNKKYHTIKNIQSHKISRNKQRLKMNETHEHTHTHYLINSNYDGITEMTNSIAIFQQMNIFFLSVTFIDL